MAGSAGHDRLHARMTDEEAAHAGSTGGLGLDLDLTATKPPALHGGAGWIDFGPAGGSYYYSRTAMDATGSVTLDGRTLTVEGSAWFDHQWGDFISVGGGGWDWYALNLDDGTDLTLSLVREADGSYPLIYGTIVGPDGVARNLDRDAFTRRGDRPLAQPDDGRDLPGRLDGPDPGRRPHDRPGADRRRAGARHAGDDRGHLLGGLAARPRDAARDRRSVAKATWS